MKRERAVTVSAPMIAQIVSPRVNSLGLDYLIVQRVAEWFLMYILDRSHRLEAEVIHAMGELPVKLPPQGGPATTN